MKCKLEPSREISNDIREVFAHVQILTIWVVFKIKTIWVVFKIKTIWIVFKIKNLACI